MAKITSSRKLVVEDYPSDSRPLVQRLAQVLNGFLDQAATAINGGLTIRENLKSKVYSISLPAGTSTQTVAFDLNERPSVVALGNLTKSDTTSPTAVFSLSWRIDSKGLHLSFLGLDAATAHTATVIALV
jgi:hypothetical protein